MLRPNRDAAARFSPPLCSTLPVYRNTEPAAISACTIWSRSARRSQSHLWLPGTQRVAPFSSVKSVSAHRVLMGINPLRGQNNVQGSCDMGSFPHEWPGYRHIMNDSVRASFESAWNVGLSGTPGLRIPNMLDAACAGEFRGIYIQGEDIAQSDPNTQHVEEALGAMECVIVQDLFLNETAKFAHVFFPGTSFLEKDGTFINAERRINRVRPVMQARTGMNEWEVTQEPVRECGIWRYLASGDA